MSIDTVATSFSSDELRTLTAVLDEIVPPSHDGRLPGAGEAGLAATIDRLARDKPELRPALGEGLAAADSLARARGAKGFAELARDARLEVLNETAARAPAFLPGLVAQTIVAYYQVDRVREALGFEARPPYPQGYPVEPTDFAILDPVRRREPFFRTP